MARRSGGGKLFQRQKELKEKDFQRKKADKSKIPDVIIACEVLANLKNIHATTCFEC